MYSGPSLNRDSTADNIPLQTESDAIYVQYYITLIYVSLQYTFSKQCKWDMNPRWIS